MMSTHMSAHDVARIVAVAAVAGAMIASGCAGAPPRRAAKPKAVAATPPAPRSTRAAEPAALKPAAPAPVRSEPETTAAKPECAGTHRGPLSIIPGAAGFGMETPAGSGRHLVGVRLEPGWDAALVGSWDFDDGAPAGGALSGDASLVERDGGRALSLKGKGSLQVPNDRGYAEPGGSFTIMAWVRMEAPLGTVAENADERDAYWCLARVRHGVHKWMFKAADGRGGAALHVIDTPAEGSWQHVAGAYDGATGRMRLFINETKVGDTVEKGVKGLPGAPSRRLALGKGLRGTIDDVMLFGAALTDEQILALYAKRHSAYFGDNRTTVYRVTNVNTAGPGSLRAALEARGPRVVIFEVSGNIDFTPHGHLRIANPYVTVAGQTAPSPGITLKGCELSVSTHDVLLQHIRIRAGDLYDPEEATRYQESTWTQFSERDCMKVASERVVIDHCSFSWATDENVQSRANRLTFRHNIFSECLGSTNHHKGAHSRGLLLMNQSGSGNRREGQELAVIGNLFAHNKTRNPSALHGTTLVLANNLVYDANVGMKCDDAAHWALLSATCNVTKRTNHPMVARGKWPETRLYFAPDNLLNGNRYGSVAEVWRHVSMPFKPGVLEMARATSAPITVPGLTVLPADEVEQWVLTNAGARPADRDPVDARIVRDVREGTGTIIASQKDVGGWPELAENRRALTVPEKPNGDDDGDGFTNLEEWLHDFAAEVEGAAR